MMYGTEMSGYTMGFGWLWMGLTLVIVGLSIAALVKYLRN